MSPTALFGLQFSFSLVLSGLVATWYVWPRLKTVPVSAALPPLFLAHALRYLPMTAFAPGQIGPGAPMDAMAAIAYGDLASAILALVAAAFLYYLYGLLLVCKKIRARGLTGRLAHLYPASAGRESRPERPNGTSARTRLNRWAALKATIILRFRVRRSDLSCHCIDLLRNRSGRFLPRDYTAAAR
jgi:hypothetical protein